MKNLLFCALALAVAAGCSSSKTDPTSDGGSSEGKDGGGSDAAVDGASSDGGTGSISCYIATQQRCVEDPIPTDDQRTNLPVECSSTSGELKEPAACPQTGFVGKCTLGSGKGTEIRRFYTGRDVAYEKDFCTNTVMGVWSTTF